MEDRECWGQELESARGITGAPGKEECFPIARVEGAGFLADEYLKMGEILLDLESVGFTKARGLGEARPGSLLSRACGRMCIGTTMGRVGRVRPKPGPLVPFEGLDLGWRTSGPLSAV